MTDPKLEVSARMIPDIQGRDLDPGRDAFGEETPRMTPIEPLEARISAVPVEDLPGLRARIISDRQTIFRATGK